MTISVQTWPEMELQLAAGMFTPQTAMAFIETNWINPLPPIDPMATLPSVPPLTPQDAPPGTNFLPGNMPVTGPVNTNPVLELNDNGAFVPAPSALTLSVDPVATSLAATGVTVYQFGFDHGGGNN